MPGTFQPHFELVKYRVDVENRRQAERTAKLMTEATVKLRVGDDVLHEVAEGDGPVNALDAALRKALQRRYPALARMQPDRLQGPRGQRRGRHGRPDSRDDRSRPTASEVWGTVGVDENIIQARWLALVEAIEYKLCKDDVAMSAKSTSTERRQDRRRNGNGRCS